MRMQIQLNKMHITVRFQSAETIINQTTNPTMSVDDVNRATSAVTSNKNALNGDEKLAQSKTDAARAIDALPHLNNAQKADVKSKINAASNIAGVNTVKQQGTDLNTAIGNFKVQSMTNKRH